MTLSQYRTYISKFILYANLVLFVVIIVLFLLKGFTFKELQEILKYLVPIKSLYMTVILKFILNNKTEIPVEKEIADGSQITPLYKTMGNLMVMGHISILTLSIIACAFNLISFNVLTYTVSIVETFFGAYVGLIIIDLFKTD